MRDKTLLKTAAGLGIAGLIIAIFIGTTDPETKIPNPITVDGETIEFTYTDDNIDEDLIIFTDEQTYTAGLSHALVYVAVVNNSGEEQDVELLGYFRDDKQHISDVKVLTEVTEEKTDLISSEVCRDVEVVGSSTKKTTIERVCKLEVTGEATSTVTNLRWSPLSIVERTTSEKTKEVVKDRKPVVLTDKQFAATKKSEGYSVPVDGVIYYRVMVEFSPRTADGFFFEAIGSAGGYGHLF